MLARIACALALAAVVSTTALSVNEIGSGFCFGVGCSCGNDDPTGGCANSTGQGGLLTATGSTSRSADDAMFHASRLPPNKVALFILSTNQRDIAFGDGRLCVGPGMHRVGHHFNSGSTGSIDATGLCTILAAHGTDPQPGETWYVQLWYRDPVPGFACTNGATTNFTNITNAYTVTFTP